MPWLDACPGISTTSMTEQPASKMKSGSEISKECREGGAPSLLQTFGATPEV